MPRKRKKTLTLRRDERRRPTVRELEKWRRAYELALRDYGQVQAARIAWGVIDAARPAGRKRAA